MRMQFADMAIVAGKFRGRQTPLAVTTFFMSVRRAKLHWPERPGGRFCPLRRRFRQQFKLVRFDATLAVRGTETVRSRITSADDDYPFPLRGDRLIAERNACRTLILLGKIFHRKMHTFQLASGNG